MDRTYGLAEFSRRFHHALVSEGIQVVWFLGAGCSVTSGIPGAGDLVRRWMRTIEGFKGDEFAAWAKESFPGWEDDPAPYYGPVIGERFDGDKARQDEIARLVRGKEPGYGYACLAQLMTHEVVGRRNNVVLTTNFDDLVADALYLYTHQKPLTVAHESLSRFVRSSDSVPLVVKVHGDSQLAPRNTESETEELHQDLTRALRHVLHDAVFVFVGYAGADQSVRKFLQGCEPQQIARAYWVGRSLPADTELRQWLESHPGAAHVPHRGFDALMAELKAEFDLGEPDFDRFDKLRTTYRETAKDLATGPPSESGASARGADAAERSVEAIDAWALVVRARALEDSDPGACEPLYRQAIGAAPDNSGILGNYAVFLKRQGRTDEAETMLQRAIDADPTHANNLGNYAVFLTQQGRTDEAETMYQRAIDTDPTHAHNLGNYATLLERLGRTDEAGTVRRRAIDADPTHAHNLGGYANHLAELGRTDEAETMYQRAIDADPTDANNLGNYARLLLGDRRRSEGRRHLASAFAAITTTEDPEAPPSLFVELLLYAYIDETPGHDDALSRLKERLVDGERSPGWDFGPVIDAVADDTGRNVELLRALAAVASDEAPVESLEGFHEWREA